jgi:hypothetical protein
MQPGAPHDAELPCSVNSGNIPTLGTMANNAVAFNEGPTYLLVRPLGGLQVAEGQAMTVQDHASSKLGVRKRVAGPAAARANFINNLPPEQFFANRVALRTHIPRLLNARSWAVLTMH